MEQCDNKKKKLLSIVGLMAVIIALFGVTYAFFNYTKTGLANTITVGKVSFNTSQSSNNISLNNIIPISSSDVLTDTNNVGVLSIDISGDTEYSEGIEYLLTAVDVNNTVNDKTVPISIMVTYEEKTGKSIGSRDDTYFANRGGNTSIYKILSEDSLRENGRFLVGYIKPDTTGIDGTITIYAYIDSDDIIVSDTFEGETDKVVLTTDEWNGFIGNNALGFKVKVEAKAGIWVENITNVYAITFLSEGGSSVRGIEVTQGDIVGEFPSKPTRSGYVFKGWYTEANNGTEVTELTQVNGNMTLHAQWDKLVCMKATYQHTETCQQSGNNGCRKATYDNNGTQTTYTNGTTIRYGTLPGNNSPARGFAYDCDVNNDNNYTPKKSEQDDKYFERFYYIRTTDSGYSSLVFFTSVDENGVADTRDKDANNAYIQEKSYTYANAPTYLPTFTVGNTTVSWNNPYLREFSGRNSRLVSQDDLVTGCDATDFSSISLNKCQYFLENSRFQNNNMGRAGIWISSSGGYRIHTGTFAISTGTENTVRPVIEIPTRLIEGYVETYHVTFNSQGGSSVSGRDLTEGSELGTLPANPHKPGYIFVGWYTTPSYTKAVTSETIIESDRTFYAKWEEDSNFVVTHTVTLNAGDGSVLDSEIIVNEGDEVGNIPTPTPPSGYIFDAWYSQDNSVIYNEETIVNNDMTFYARYAPSGTVCKIAVGDYYTSIQSAADSITPNDRTTIYMLADVTDNRTGNEAVIINLNTNSYATKDIVLDMQGHSIDYTGASKVYVIRTKAALEIKNGTISSNAAGTAAINIETGGKLVMNDGSVVATGDRHAIYNNGGTVNIGGTASFSSKASGAYNNVPRGTVTNYSGTMTLTGGNIVNTSGSAVAMGDGTLTIGVNDGTIDTTSLVMQGNAYGLEIKSGSTVIVYDGMFKGKTAGISNTAQTTHPNNTEYDTNDTENSYKLAYLYYTVTPSPLPTASTYTITYHSEGGTISPTTVQITQGSSITNDVLPTTKTWGSKTFAGWYLDENYNNAVVTGTTTPNSDTTYYAKWTYTPASSLVNYDTTNNAMTTYYSNISSWVNLTESDFMSAMSTNFTNNNCSACEGTNSCNSPGAGTRCDKPKVYDTGVNAAVNVYLYDETTHVIGKKVEYANSSSGTISNLIPGQAYYWEKASDPSINGHVQVTTPRRNLDAGNIRNVRDLGGMSISYTENNVVKTGTLKYGRLLRGARLTSSNDDITSLSNLGVTREIDLRADSEGSSQVRFPVLDNGSGGSDIVITNYLINPTATTYITTAHLSDYRNLKAAMKTVMRYIVNGDNIYFHCTIGTDRTGTIAYFLEGLLGVSEEDRLEDYELTYFYGMTNRTRYHDNLSGSSINPRFTSMYRSYPTNQDIYNFYKYEPESDDDTLLAAFRQAMINFNS